MTSNYKIPIVTRFLVFLNIVIHISIIFYALFIKADVLIIQNIYYQFGLVPVSFWDGAVWQPFTSLFLHGFDGLSLHLFVNMLALWTLGSAIEQTIGSIAFTWLYFISGLFGSLAVILFQPDLSLPTIGASGAIMGLLSALAIFYPNSILLVFFFPVKARTAAIIFGLGSFVLAFLDQSSNISHFGHFGGFLGGFLYTKLALRLRVGRNTLFSYKDFYQKQEEEILEKIKNIEELRKNLKNSPTFYISDSDTNDVINEPPRQSKAKKIFFDPETGKFYIIE